MKIKPEFILCADKDAVAAKACEIFIESADAALRQRGRFLCAISGGQTPITFFKFIVSRDRELSLDWQRIHIFWVDERFVPVDHKDNNYQTAAELFLNNVNIPLANIHRIKTEFKDAASAAKDYEDHIRAVFALRKYEMPRFDLVMLGMGADGHTASLFAGSPAICDTAHLFAAVHEPNITHDRITLTGQVLKAAEKILLQITGTQKTEMLREVFTTEADAMKRPVQLLLPIMDNVTWLVDQDAATRLPQNIKYNRS